MAKEEDKKTPEKEPEKKETQAEDSYEKRYKNSQSHITKIEQENATMREAATKDKELLDALSPFVNWDAATSGTQTAPEAVQEDGEYVDKKTLNKTIKDLRNQMWRNEQTQNFRIDFPDMVPYEDLVSVFLGKTDTRRPFKDRIKSAVESTKKLIESERAKGIESYEKEKKKKEAREAEAAGLSVAKGPKGEEKEPSEGETFKEYVEGRKALLNKVQGIPEL